MADKKDLRVAIIGAGPSGIASGHELLKQGFTNFTIFEKSDGVGGTWHLHTYPGLACDVWAHSYTFSYEPNPDWSASFVEQAEIEAYLQRSATKFGLDPHIRLNTKIITADYQSSGSWLLGSEAGEQFEFDVIINAMGNQHTPLYPNAEGIDTFKGDYWHGTQWNHDVDLKGKRVAVIGSAASAVQIVPEIAKQADHLTVLQRTPNWIMPRGRKLYSESRRKWNKRLPFLMSLTKAFQGFIMGLVHQAATIGHKRMGQFEDTARKFINESFPEGELRDAMTPTSHYACKRGLVSDDFYPALNKDHVELIPEGLTAVTENSIITASGREVEIDVIIYCTGYRILDFDRITVTGLNNKVLANVMEQAPEAHKGIAVPDFPNYFFAVGPNGLVLNVAYFVTVEKNVETIVRLLKDKQAADIEAISVKKDLHRQYNDWLGTQFGLYAWGASSCNSYYRSENGHVPFLFAGSYKRYCEFHAECGLHEFDHL